MVSVTAFMIARFLHSMLCRRPIVWVVCACVVGGVWLAGPVSQAQATCGDYLIVGNSRFPMGHDSMPGQHAPGESSQPKPCHGPECSSNQEPVAALNVVVRVSHDPTWAVLTSHDGTASFPPYTYLVCERSHRPQQTPSRLFRPPEWAAL
jgi:hypothetical protein